ncbi:calcium/sodium antiporter [Pseudooceanicola nanhaiensis]|uniref:calcium/sodium antiporter n=1 Tax=Pseudooceanicola nanhaiensis TaxID=375761 RepID=UPI0035160B1E
MELLQAVVLALAGLGVLVLAGDLLVRGAVNLSLRIGIPALIVSLTIVAFGTSAPELLVSIDAVLSGAPGLALGNVVGSNIANILLVLGVPAMISGLHSSTVDTRHSYLVMMAGTVLFIGLAQFGQYGRIAGMILFVALILSLWDQFRDAKAHRAETKAAATEEALEGANPHMRMWKILAFLAAGIVGLPIGARLLVENATVIATAFGVSDAVIGLTLVAIGTSAPELATTVAAALRKQADVALGNVIGSNLFNLLGIVGVTALIAPIPVDEQIARFDLWVMLGSSLLLAPFVLRRRDIGRVWGVALTAAYLVYLLLVLI